MKNEDRGYVDVAENKSLNASPQSEHPAVARLRDRLASSAQKETPISTYDRMHHRHARS
jgi:hypothetical protein